MKPSNKQLKEEYKRAVRPMGVFQIRNLKNEKVFVVAESIRGIINRHRFALVAGGHANKHPEGLEQPGGERLSPLRSSTR